MSATSSRPIVLASCCLAAAVLLASCSSSSGSGAGETSAPATAPASSAASTIATTAPPTTEATTTTAAPEVVTIHTDGFGEAMLNDDPETVIAYFTSLYGPPISDSGWLPNSEVPLCDTDTFRAVKWPFLYTVYASRDALGAGRTAEQNFVFFLYGLTEGVWPTDPVATDEGLLPGDTVTRLQELYPGVVVYDGSLGGGRFFKTHDDRNLGPNGMLTGSSPEVVSAIEVGDWPCADTD